VKSDDPLAVSLKQAIQGGDLDALRELLAREPALATARLVDRKGSRTALHLATDWPGFFPQGPEVVAMLVAAGADPNIPAEGAFPETPLHWAASSDDVEVARTLLDLGAHLEVRGACIAGGTPLYDAVAFGCWRVARLLVERGAQVERLWQAAALGLHPLVREFLAGNPPRQDVTDAFWQACHGGHRRMAEFLLAQGADLDGTPSWGGGDTPMDIAGKVETGRQALLTWLQERGARPRNAGQ
jgi:ankyrin repeat protein